MSLDEVQGWYNKEIIYESKDGIIHIADGSELVRRTFVLWTLCGKMDIPANKGFIGQHISVTCPECLQEMEHIK